MLVAFFFAIPSAFAQITCAPRDKILEYLSKTHAETPVIMALNSNGSILEVLVSKKDTWTMIQTSPQGRTCAVAVGEAWGAVTPTVAPETPS